MDSVSSRLLDKRYRITNLLHEDATERHYAARHVELDIPVCIVTLSLPSSTRSQYDATASRLWALAARASALRHPSLVRVRDCFRYRRTFSVVAEWVAGETLAERIVRLGGISLRETLTYGLQLCDLLTYVAREGATISPLLSVAPDSLVVQHDDRIVLADLGAGRWLNEHCPFYSPDRLPFVAPEVLVGAQADARADIYSVAAVLYAALSGEPPAPFGMGLLPLSILTPLAPAALCDTLERALQPDPADRFATPEHFGRALGRSVRATMPGVAALAKQPRRGPTGVTVARALASSPLPLEPAATASADEPGRAGRRPHAWARDVSRVTAPRPLRRTGERALAAISSALRLGS